jgi:hypothetical protein
VPFLLEAVFVFFFMALDFGTALALDFLAAGFFFAVFFAFKGFFTAVLREDFFKAITNPFYKLSNFWGNPTKVVLWETRGMIVISSLRSKKNG